MKLVDEYKQKIYRINQGAEKTKQNGIRLMLVRIIIWIYVLKKIAFQLNAADISFRTENDICSGKILIEFHVHVFTNLKRIF